MKNICFFNSVKFWGGGEKLHFEYAEALHKKGYSIFVVAAPNSPFAEKSKKAGFRTHEIKIGNLSFLNPFKQSKLSRYFTTNNIDTVIFSGSHDMKIGGFAAKKAKLKRIVYLRGLAAPIKKKWLNVYLFKNVITHIVASSMATKKAILSQLSEHIPESKIRVVYHGVDPSLFTKSNTLAEIKREPNKIILGNAGRLTPGKGLHHLTEIALKLKKKGLPFHLYIAGTGPLESELIANLQVHDLENQVTLLGFVEDIQAFMNSIDLFTFTSESEGFGFVLVEALLKETPVLSFNISSMPEIVSHQKSGILIEPFDIEAYCNQIEFLYHNADSRAQYGKFGKADVSLRFSLEQSNNQFESFLLENQ